jgi:hypothetical protein
MFWKIFSPENRRPKPPVPEVLISMFDDIHTMDPPSVIIDSFASSLHSTTGNEPPMIS